MSSSEGVGKHLAHIKHLWTCFSFGRRLDGGLLRVVCWIVIKGSTSSEGSNMGSSVLGLWGSSIHFGVSSWSSSNFGSVFISTMPLDISINVFRSSLTSIAFVKCSSNVLNFAVHFSHTGTLRLITWTPEIDSKIVRNYRKFYKNLNWWTYGLARGELFWNILIHSTGWTRQHQHVDSIRSILMNPWIAKSSIICLPFEWIFELEFLAFVDAFLLRLCGATID